MRSSKTIIFKDLSFSAIVPCHNEEGSLEKVVAELVAVLSREKIDYEIIIVDDNSADDTGRIADRLARENSRLKVINRFGSPGFGKAVKEGLDRARGEVIIPVMGDGSDEAKDVIKLYREIEKGYDVVYGSRFRPGTIVRDYPVLKFLVNRLANQFIRLFFLIRENDITNAFKAYRRYVLEKIKPIEATEFNITVELPLKALAAGFNKTEVPVNWYGRNSGISKYKLIKISRRYLGTIFKIWWRYRFRSRG